MSCSCGCNTCNGSVEASSGCGNTNCSCCSTAAVGVPYYSCSSMCPEDNSCTTTITKIAGVFRTLRSFVMPACGSTVQVTFESITALPIGAWMWAGDAGRFEITGYDATTGIVQLKNLCPDSPCDNAAAPGASIPSCTVFILSAPNCDVSTANPNAPFPYLDADFVAPANGVCIQISLTSVNGLGANQNVSIAGGTYSIESVDSPTLITICNNGAGITPGTVVDHDDSAGHNVVPIVVIDSNPCSAKDVLSATLLGCNAGIITPLTGLVAGQIPVLQDPVTGEVEYQSIGIPMAVCTSLVICLTLDSALPANTSYSVEVVSTAGFTAGDLLQIGTTILYVDSVDGPTTMHCTPTYVDYSGVLIVSYPEASVICLVDCCTIMDNKFQTITDDIIDVANDIDAKVSSVFAIVNHGDAAPLAVTVDIVLAPGTDIAWGNIASQAFANGSALNVMGLHYVVTFVWIYVLDGDATEVVDVTHYAELYVGTNPAGVPATICGGNSSYRLIVDGDYGPGQNNQSYTFTFSGASACNVGETLYVRARCGLTYAAGTLNHIEVQQLNTRVSAIGIAPYLLAP